MASYSALLGIPARYALERHQWSEAASLPIRKVPMPLFEAETYFTKAIGCARTGDLVGAKSNMDKLAELRDRLPRGNQGSIGQRRPGRSTASGGQGVAGSCGKARGRRR